MTWINLTSLLLGFFVALTGFDGERVIKRRDAPEGRRALLMRIRPLGWAYLVALSAVLGLNVYKELRSLDRHLRLGYPHFYSLVEDVTGYRQDEWTELFSYRLSMRFMLQKLYRLTVGAHPPESIQRMLTELAKREAISEDLCARLDRIRWHTYGTEWGVAGGQGRSHVRPDSQLARETLDELAKQVEAAKPAPTKKADTSCGTYQG